MRTQILSLVLGLIGFLTQANLHPNLTYAVEHEQTIDSILLNELPSELIEEILNFLPLNELAQAQLVCKAFFFQAQELAERDLYSPPKLEYLSLIRTLKHSGPVRIVDISPDTNSIVSVSKDRTIQIWDVATGKKRRGLNQLFKRHTGRVNSAQFSPTGESIASASDDKTIRIWNSKTGKKIHTLKGHSSYVTSIQFTPVEGYILSSSLDNTIRIWRTDSTKQIYRIRFPDHHPVPVTVLFGPSVKQFITTYLWEPETIAILDRKTGKEVLKLIGHTDRVNSVALSSDRELIVSGSEDNTIKIWNSMTGEEFHTLLGHTAPVNSVRFSLAGDYVLSASVDGIIKIWDVQTGKELYSLNDHSGPVMFACFSQYDELIISASDDQTAKIWALRPYLMKGRLMHSIHTEPEQTSDRAKSSKCSIQ